MNSLRTTQAQCKRLMRRRVQGSMLRPYRDFHMTPKREVVPIIIAGLGLAVAATALRHLIQAGKKMRELEAEEKEKGISPDAVDYSAAADMSVAEAVVGPAFGIDLGTTSMRLACADAASKMPDIVESKEGFRFTPACAAFQPSQPPMVGHLAKAQRWQSPGTTVYGLQPVLGIPFDSPAVSALAAQAGFGLVEIDREEGTQVGLGLGDNVVGVEEAITAMLQNVKELKDHKVSSAAGAVAMSVPAYYDDAQQAALVRAARAAGLVVVETVKEPVAAAMAALEMGLVEGSDGLVAVLDVGGASVQCSLVDVGSDGSVAMVGAAHCEQAGAEAFDTALVGHINDTFQTTCNLDLLGDPMSLSRLHEAAEVAKVELSASHSTNINLPFITADQTGPKHVNLDISRAQFEHIIDAPLHLVEDPCTEALGLAGTDRSQIKAVLLVGGGSRMPCVQALAARVFGKEGTVPDRTEELVALGAAIAARRTVYGE